jgi:hypothetical protein
MVLVLSSRGCGGWIAPEVVSFRYHTDMSCVDGLVLIGGEGQTYAIP